MEHVPCRFGMEVSSGLSDLTFAGFRRKAGKQGVWYASGRQALFSLLSSIPHERTGDASVLLPDYHCESIVDACEKAGLTPVYYQVLENLQADMDSVTEVMSSNCIALIAVHYFGFRSALNELSKVCRELEVVLIEDAAHMDLLSGFDLAESGVSSHYVVSCPRKFYPVYDGALLHDPGDVQSPSYARRPITDELRSLAHLGNTFFSRPRTILTRRPEEFETGASFTEPRFDISRPCRATTVSRIACGFFDHVRAAEARRRNYRHIAHALENCGRSKVLFPELADDVVPYAFPLVLRFPEEDHYRIRRAGVDIMRWEGQRAGTRKGRWSALYEHALIQIPCHQGLAIGDVTAMCRLLVNILR